MKNQEHAASETLQASKEKFAEDIGSIVNEATDLLKTFSTQKLDSAKVTFAQAQTAVTDSAKQYAKKTDDYVHANPWAALGAAAAVGVLVGVLLARR